MCSHCAEFLPSFAGLQLETEISALKKVTTEIKKPITCIIGGSKISTKINVISNLIKNVNNIIIVGAMANNFLIPLVILSVLSNFLIYRGNNNDLRSILFLDSFSIIILNYFFNPILAFTIYFCFLHSIRHSLSLISEINKNLMKGFPIFLRKIIPLTVITAIMYLIVFYFISEKFGIDESIIKIIFVGLASLTFPHILLEFMVEKK